MSPLTHHHKACVRDRVKGRARHRNQAPTRENVVRVLVANATTEDAVNHPLS